MRKESLQFNENMIYLWNRVGGEVERIADCLQGEKNLLYGLFDKERICTELKNLAMFHILSEYRDYVRESKAADTGIMAGDELFRPGSSGFSSLKTAFEKGNPPGESGLCAAAIQRLNEEKMFPDEFLDEEIGRIELYSFFLKGYIRSFIERYSCLSDDDAPL